MTITWTSRRAMRWLKLLALVVVFPFGAISAEATTVFAMASANLVPGDTNGQSDVFIPDDSSTP